MRINNSIINACIMFLLLTNNYVLNLLRNLRLLININKMLDNTIQAVTRLLLV